MKTLQIGNVTLPNNLILAPMAGVTDLPFRLICKEQGAGLLCMEMVSAKAIYYNNKKILCVRGWGRLTGTGGYHLPEDKAAEIQDAFAAYCVEMLNK